MAILSQAATAATNSQMPGKVQNHTTATAAATKATVMVAVLITRATHMVRMVTAQTRTAMLVTATNTALTQIQVGAAR